MTPLVLQVSMGGGDRLPSGDPSARLPSNFIKKKRKPAIYAELFIVPKYVRNTQVHSLIHHFYNPMVRYTDTIGKRSGAVPTILLAPTTAQIILSDNQVISLQCPSQTRNNT